MNFSEFHKVVFNGITIIAWAMGIIISLVAVSKRKEMKEGSGISCGTYLSLVVVTEIIYTIGAAMILSAMGINVMQHLAKLEFWKFYQIVSHIDMSTIEIIGIIGWVGFVINRSISYVSPAYLLIRGGRKLPKYFFYSAWTEVTMETMLTILIFVSLSEK